MGATEVITSAYSYLMPTISFNVVNHKRKSLEPEMCRIDFVNNSLSSYSSGQKKGFRTVTKKTQKHLNKRRSCLSVLLAYFRRTLNVPYRASSQYSLQVSIFK